MAKKKKKKVEPLIPVVPRLTDGQYYWCVNCGHHGDFGFHRKKSVKCEMCEYDDVSIWLKEDIIELDIDNMGLERFKTKEKAEDGGSLEQPLPKDHIEMRKTTTESIKLLKELDEKYPKQSIEDKLAEIKKL